jgi:hypothetical protein
MECALYSRTLHHRVLQRIRLSALVPLFLVFSLPVAAQQAQQDSPALPVPQAANPGYIIPDLGTPGINTYIEIVGPNNGMSLFGIDGVSLNNPGDNVRVVCVRPADTLAVTIGPIVTSWNGRLIATQIFVHDGIAPNSTDWNSLTNQFCIPLSVTVAGSTVLTDTFYIVQPLAAINSVGAIMLGTGGVNGVRSPRGAMLVSGATFGGNVGVSTSDCDPSTPGNQGYLPFTLLSTGPVSFGSSSTLSVDANGKDGGPGGGGGGCGDGPTGEVGGSGFTGGGPGETHSRPATGGNGSGATGDGAQGGKALNGMPGTPADVMLCTSAGGTGNPFVANTGGIGNSSLHNGDGPGGGFATAGQTGRAAVVPPGFDFLGGVANGNPMLVPLMGGSGGGGGNEFCNFAPSGPGVTGGGAGGGIAVFSMQRATMHYVVSRGDIGVTSGSGCCFHGSYGGCGSGGGVLIGAKLASAFGTEVVTGGVSPHVHANNGSGGNGRVRVDGPQTTAPVIIPGTASLYRGPSTDTSSYVPSTFTLTGTGNGNAVNIYVKPSMSDWQLVATVPSYTGPSWSKQITLPPCDTLYYLVAAQQVPNPGTVAETMDAQWVLSQVAANVLHSTGGTSKTVFVAPTFLDLKCDTITDGKLKIRNLCAMRIRVDSIYLMANNEGFSLPGGIQFPFFLDRYTDTVFVVHFAPQSIGTKTGSIGVKTSDTSGIYTILLSGKRDSVQRVSVSATPFATLTGCDTATSGFATITNLCTNPLEIDSIYFLTNNEGFSMAPAGLVLPFYLGPLTSLRIPVTFSPVTSGYKSATIGANTSGGTVVITLAGTRAVGNGSVVQFNGPTFRTLICDTAENGQVNVRNVCGKAITIDSVFLTANNEGFSLPALPVFPMNVPPGFDGIIPVRFAPQGYGAKTGVLEIVIADAITGIATKQIPLSGNRAKITHVTATAPQFQILVCDTVAYATATITNNCDLPLIIDSLDFLVNAEGFAIDSMPALPLTIRPKSSLALRIRFAPSSTGAKHATLAVATSEGTIEVKITADYELSGAQVFPASLDFGAVAPMQLPTRRTVKIHNNGTSPMTITGAVCVPLGPFVVDNLPLTIQPGDSADLGIVFTDPDVDSTYGGTLELTLQPACSPISIAVMGTRRPPQPPPHIQSRTASTLQLLCTGITTDTITLYNVGQTTLRVDSLTTWNTPAYFHVTASTPLPADIPLGDSLAVVVTYDISAPLGGISDTLCVWSNDTSSIPWKIALTGRRDSSGLGASSQLYDLGVLCTGMSSDTTVTITNGGTVDEHVAVETSVMTLSAVRSGVLPVGSTLSIPVHVAGRALAGEWYDTVRVLDSTCGAFINIVLHGNVVAPSLTIDSTAIYVWCATGDTTTIITNTGSVPVTVTRVSTGDAQFTVDAGTIPFVLAAGERRAVRVHYSPLSMQGNQTMIVVEGTPCGITASAVVMGSMQTAMIDVTFPLGASVTAGDTVGVPMVITSPLLAALVGTRPMLRISYDNMRLFPMMARGGTETITGPGVITFVSNGVQADGTVGTIVFLALAGDTGLAVLTIDSISTPPCNVIASLHQGGVTVSAACGMNGYAITRNSLAELLPNVPNPFNERTDLQFRTSSSTWARVIVCDLFGRMVFERQGRLYSIGTQHVALDGESLSAGAYVVTLETPRGALRRMIMLAH